MIDTAALVSTCLWTDRLAIDDNINPKRLPQGRGCRFISGYCWRWQLWLEEKVNFDLVVRGSQVISCGRPCYHLNVSLNLSIFPRCASCRPCGGAQSSCNGGNHVLKQMKGHSLGPCAYSRATCTAREPEAAE